MNTHELNQEIGGTTWDRIVIIMDDKYQLRRSTLSTVCLAAASSNCCIVCHKSPIGIDYVTLRPYIVGATVRG